MLLTTSENVQLLYFDRVQILQVISMQIQFGLRRDPNLGKMDKSQSKLQPHRALSVNYLYGC